MKQIVCQLLLIFPFLCYSQVQVSGTVRDSSEPIEFANVILKDVDGEMVNGTITDVDGRFLMTSSKGAHKIVVSFMGYEHWGKEINIQQNMDLGILVLKPNKNELEEVIIKSKGALIQQKADRLIFNVQNSIKPIGGNSLDILKYVPTVISNEDGINILGKDGVQVLVNGKKIPLSGSELSDYLSTLVVDDISKIEVFRTPPAKYDAEGNVGMLNIILKPKDKDAYNATIGSSYIQNTYPTGVYFGYFNLKKGKLSLFTNVKYTNGNSAFLQQNDFIYPTFSWVEERNRKDSSDYLNYNLTTDYQISSKTNVGIQYYLSDSKPNGKMNARTEIVDRNTNLRDSIIYTNSNLNYRRKMNTISINSITKLDNDKQITFSADYFNFNRFDESIVDTQTFFEDRTFSDLQSIRSDGEQDINVYTAQLDFELPIKKVNLSFGGKVSFINNSSKNNYSLTLDSPQFNSFKYDENIQAIYISANKEFSGWDFQFGLRVEHNSSKNLSQLLNQTIKRKYTEVFPTINISKELNKDNILAFSYNRRVLRPDYKDLDPFRLYFNTVNYSEGNPFLLPSFTNNIELTYIHKKLYSSIFFNFLSDGSNQITFLNENDNTQINRPLNFFEQRNFGFSENYTFNAFKWWESNNQLKLSHAETISSIPETRKLIKENTFFFITSNVFILNKKKTLQLELEYLFQSPSISGSYKTTSYSYFNTSLRASLLNKRLSISIAAKDIFRTHEFTFNNEINGIKFNSLSYPDRRKIILKASYKFGNSFRRVRKKNSNTEEKRRL